MFNIELYVNTSEDNRVDKTLTAVTTISGSLRDGCSIIDPEVLITGALETVGDVPGLSIVNYAVIPDFGRSYFVRNITSVRQGLLMMSMHVDVLSSFKEALRANKAIVRRAESPNAYNLYLNDGSLKAYQNPFVLTEPFPYGFDSIGFVLAVAGG